MSDLCRVLMVGNLSRDLERHVRADGVTYGVSTLCTARMHLVAGHPVLETTRITMEVVGAVRVAGVAQQFGAGSRVLVEGHLELREATRIERLPLADGMSEVLVHVPRSELVLVVETIFNADPPLPAAEAQRQPAQVWWQEVS
ncbi:MAG: hypothetical protein OHK0015_45180 [Chloroflexi bacterium OHK40]